MIVGEAFQPPDHLFSRYVLAAQHHIRLQVLLPADAAQSENDFQDEYANNRYDQGFSPDLAGTLALPERRQMWWRRGWSFGWCLGLHSELSDGAGQG